MFRSGLLWQRQGEDCDGRRAERDGPDRDRAPGAREVSAALLGQRQRARGRGDGLPGGRRQAAPGEVNALGGGVFWEPGIGGGGADVLGWALWPGRSD